MKLIYMVMKNFLRTVSAFTTAIILTMSCQQQSPDQNQEVTSNQVPESEKVRVLFDTDANNELDDQHALAYLLFNGDVFEIEGITVNRTHSGGAIERHMEEAERVVKLCAAEDLVEVYKGADGSFEEIRDYVHEIEFDGYEAVNHIIERAKASGEQKLILLPVGKLTNIALAIEKDSSIIPHIDIVWLGSNYPEPGEYNQDNDIPALNYILDKEVPFEIAMVRYGKPSGTDAVRVTPEEINEKMPGAGPEIDEPVTGRHGGKFTNFGDYSVSLFEHIDLHGDPPSRALFDMAAVAIVKNPSWAEKTEIPAPIMKDGEWQERPDNNRKIVIWENFDSDVIMNDFYETMEKYTLPQE